MWAAAVSPAKWEGLFVDRSSLEEEFVLAVEKKDAEGSVRDGLLRANVFIFMSIPFIDGSKEGIVFADSN